MNDENDAEDMMNRDTSPRVNLNPLVDAQRQRQHNEAVLEFEQ